MAAEIQLPAVTRALLRPSAARARLLSPDTMTIGAGRCGRGNFVAKILKENA